MAGRKAIYFVSDVHLGMHAGNPSEREERFLNFLRSIPRDTTKAVYMLGDIWDFWYEYRDLMPKEGIRVVMQMKELLDAGVEVHFFPGNHDMWVGDFFPKMGVIMHEQPCFVELGGKVFCLGHGDIVGGTDMGYRFLHWVYTSPVIQFIFKILHPGILFAMSYKWFKISRNSHSNDFEFVPGKQRIVKWAEETGAGRHVDCFIFGHFHRFVDIVLDNGARFLILPDWEGGSSYVLFDGESVEAVTF